MKEKGLSLVELLIVIAFVAIVAAIVVPYVVKRHDSKQQNPIAGPLATNDEWPLILTGTIFRIDRSNPDLLQAGLEMVELKLDKNDKIAIDYAACPAPIGKFQMNEKATLKSFYFQASGVDPRKWRSMLVKP